MILHSNPTSSPGRRGKKEKRSYKSSYIIYIVLGKEERASCFLKKLISNCIVKETELPSWHRQTPMTHGCNFPQRETMLKDYLFECMQCWLISLQSPHIWWSCRVMIIICSKISFLCQICLCWGFSILHFRFMILSVLCLYNNSKYCSPYNSPRYNLNYTYKLCVSCSHNIKSYMRLFFCLYKSQK